MLSDHPTVQLDPIPGFPGYFACRLGVIFSMRWRWTTYPIPLKPRTGKDGYHNVSLHRNGKRYLKRVHHLVLETYVGSRAEGMECRHLNNIPTDNRLSNLAWGTVREQNDDKIAAGSLKGTRNSAAKLTEDDVRAIRTMTTAEAVKRYGISRVTALRVRKRQSWSHIN